MCNLDVIAMTPEEEFRWWLTSSMNDPEFVVTLVVFGAVFLLLISVFVLFAVMLVRYFRGKSPNSETLSDGNIHILPFLSGVLASGMFLFGTVMVIIDCFFYGSLPMGSFPDTASVWYTVFMCAFFGIALWFSPRAGKAFKIWIISCLVITALYVFCVIYFRIFVWFAWGSVEVFG